MLLSEMSASVSVLQLTLSLLYSKYVCQINVLLLCVIQQQSASTGAVCPKSYKSGSKWHFYGWPRRSKQRDHSAVSDVCVSMLGSCVQCHYSMHKSISMYSFIALMVLVQ